MPSSSDNPVQRIRNVGMGGASPIDLIAVAFSRTERDAAEGENMARTILAKCGKIRALAELSSDMIREETGLEGYEITRCQALMELGRRAAHAGQGEREEIACAADVYQLLRFLKDEKREHFCVVLLDSKNQILKYPTVHIGTLNMALVGPREVFREAIREGACCIIVAHNHPSGDPTPSPEDIDVTDKLAELGKMLDIEVLDHVIIGERNYVSMKERGLME